MRRLYYFYSIPFPKLQKFLIEKKFSVNEKVIAVAEDCFTT
jgi:hypothetical protein